MGDLHKCPTCGHMAIVCEDEYKQLERDLAARDAELKAIAHHVGGGAFYRDEHGGRLPMRDQVGQHIAELNQQLAARDAELKAIGRWLAPVLNEDKWPTAERFLNAALLQLLESTERAEAAERKAEEAERYKNPSDEAINASFAGLIETQDVPGQIKRRAEFKRRYLLVIAAIAAKGEA